MYRLRLKFHKLGPIKFLGHLDVMRYFQKAIRRAHIDVKYSEGYHPHQILSFAQPLGVGITSEGEYLDMTVVSLPDEGVAKIMHALNSTMNEGITVTDICILPETAEKAMTAVSAASYAVRFREGYAPPAGWERHFTSFCERDTILATKKTKKGERDLDIKPYLHFAEVTTLENAPSVIRLTLAAGSEVNIKPELFIGTFLKETYNTEIIPLTLVLHREELYQTMHTEAGEKYLAPLIPKEWSTNAT